MIETKADVSESSSTSYMATGSNAVQENEIKNNGNNSSDKHCGSILLRKTANGVLVFFIIFPLIVTFWRGTWGIMDLLIFPSNIESSAWTCTGLGFGIIFLYMVVQNCFIQRLQTESSTLACLAKTLLLLSVTFVYVLALSTVASWRGVWLCLDIYFTGRNLSALLTHVFGVIALWATETFTSVISAPGFVVRDCGNQPLIFNLAIFNCFPSNSPAKKLSVIKTLLNCFVTVCLIGVSLVCYWRGTWTLMINSFPEDKTKSSLTCLLVGYTVSISCYCLKDILRTQLESKKIDRISKFIQFIFVYFLAFGVVAVWKGFWDLIDFLVATQTTHLELSVIWIICNCVSFILLSVMNASVNLIGCPAGCRISSKTSLSGFDMGYFLNPRKKVEVKSQVQISAEKEHIDTKETVM